MPEIHTDSHSVKEVVVPHGHSHGSHGSHSSHGSHGHGSPIISPDLISGIVNSLGGGGHGHSGYGGGYGHGHSSYGGGYSHGHSSHGGIDAGLCENHNQILCQIKTFGI